MNRYYTPVKISENIRKTQEGYLLCLEVPIGRTGEMEYGPDETPLPVGDSGLVVIDRTEKELFDAKTMASFEGKPITIKHPEDFVNPDNWTDLAKGMVLNVRRSKESKEDLVADLLIQSADAISLVNEGLREVSCGYEAEYEQTGEGRGRQFNIRGNHLALVREGRAGPSYRINDHKRKVSQMTLAEKFKALMAKFSDEAVKVLDEEAPKKDEPKEEKAKDAGAYDELVQVCNALMEKIDAMKPKDEAPKEEMKKEDKPMDEEKPKEESKDASVEERLAKIEAALAKLMEGKADAGDEESEEKEEAADEDVEITATGDEKSRVEILAPGMELTESFKVDALKKAFDSKDGKEAITKLTGGKAPAFDSKEQVDMLFIGASELLKSKRTGSFSKTKAVDQTAWQSSLTAIGAGGITAEKINEMNSKTYKLN